MTLMCMVVYPKAYEKCIRKCPKVYESIRKCMKVCHRRREYLNCMIMCYSEGEYIS